MGDPDEHLAAVSLRTAAATECPRNPVQWTIFNALRPTMMDPETQFIRVRQFTRVFAGVPRRGWQGLDTIPVGIGIERLRKPATAATNRSHHHLGSAAPAARNPNRQSSRSRPHHIASTLRD